MPGYERKTSYPGMLFLVPNCRPFQALTLPLPLCHGRGQCSASSLACTAKRVLPDLHANGSKSGCRAKDPKQPQAFMELFSFCPYKILPLPGHAWLFCPVTSALHHFMKNMPEALKLIFPFIFKIAVRLLCLEHHGSGRAATPCLPRGRPVKNAYSPQLEKTSRLT